MSLKRHSPFKDSHKGLLYLVSTPVGNLGDLTPRAKEILEKSDIIFCEDTRRTTSLLMSLGIHPKKVVACYSQNEAQVGERYFSTLESDKALFAYCSDAGAPGISDPGAILASLARKYDIEVSFLPGASALIHALVMSGFDTADFAFFGFPPVKEGERKSFFQRLTSYNEALIFYEAPHRLLKTLTSMSEVFGFERKISLARELTKIHEEYIQGSLAEVIEALKEEEIRGEFVLVLAPEKSNDDEKWIQAKKAAEKLQDLGYSSSEIARILAAVLELPRNALYSKLNSGE